MIENTHTHTYTDLADDEAFALYRRFRTMEGAAMRLQKEAKGYLDSLRGRDIVLSCIHIHPLL